jgi:putative phosphoribosyl transferase
LFVTRGQVFTIDKGMRMNFLNVNPKSIIFRDRRDAGQKLAKKLAKYKNENPLILGMPRGGVVVAYEIAHELEAELSVIVARKIGLPSMPELAIGAVAPEDIIIWNEEMIRYFNISEAQKAELAFKAQEEMKRRIQLFCADIDLHQKIKNRVVIVVDDGLATGLTALATVEAVKKMQPKSIVLAVGVSAIDSANILKAEVDELICLSTPENFEAVGLWYKEFSQTSDQEVLELLAKNKKEQSQHNKT